MSIISTVLAEISTHDLQNIDHIDHVDHLDHIDHVDLGHIDHIDHLDHIDHVDLGHIDHVDHLDHIDHVDHFDDTGDSSIFNDTTPAPFMLLFSTSLLFFGISGILFYYVFYTEVKFLIFFATLGITYLITKLISTTWKKIAKSKFYNISSTQNLIGQKGVIVLDVDRRGGIVKIPSNNPMKFERIHVKPINPDSSFEKGVEVYICDIKDGFLLVDNKASSIRYGMR
ncbi:MAG: NfeD family protein [Promethearchaeota archaeon]